MCEKNITISKLIVLANGMLSACHRIKITLTTNMAKKAMTALLDQIFIRFRNMEKVPVLAKATLLDPRFKKNSFRSDSLCDLARQSIENHICNQMISESEKLETEASANESREEIIQSDDLLWGGFDRRNSAAMSKETPRSNAIVEMRQYLQESPILRKNDPLAWWKSRQNVYPHLFKLAETHMCMMATSVPSERIFSKCGQLISERRSRLKPKNVEMVIFLNANYKLFK